MFPANSEWGLIAVLPEEAMSVTCEGLLYSPRIESPLELASSESLFLGGAALLSPGLRTAALPVWFTAGPCPVSSSWHSMLGWCSLWKPLECKWPLYDRNTTKTFPKGAVRCGGLSTDFPTRLLEQVQCRIATVLRREQMTIELSNSPSPFLLQPFDSGGATLVVRSPTPSFWIRETWEWEVFGALKSNNK